MEELISVVIPIYNVEKFITRCIDSVLKQSYERLEIILVDDGSTDHSGEICEQYKNKDSRVQVFHQDNKGLGAARNSGMKLATGKYIAFVDSDDWIEPETYEYLYKALVDNQCNIACCGRKETSDTRVLNTSFCKNEPLILKNEQIICSYLLQKDFDMSVCDKLFERVLFTGVEFPEGKLNSEDTVPTYQVMKRAHAIICTGKPFYNYYIRVGSISRSSFRKNYMGVIYYSESVLEDVRNNYPTMINEAQSFYFDRLISVWRLIVRCNYEGDERRAVKSKILDNKTDIIKNPCFPNRLKLFAVLIPLKLDRIYDRFYLRVRRILRKV